jgi:hypothetical protein
LARQRTLQGIFLCSSLFFAASCNKTDNSKANYQSAINNFYKAHPACLWPEAKKFPVQAATSDDSKTEGYDALTDAGLLTRSTAEKKVFIIASKQVNNYDVSDKGRAVWMQDPSQPGYGNFCYGHREVTSIDSFAATKAPTSGQNAVLVNYHYKIGDLAPWANSQEMRTAFPSLNSTLSDSQPAQATLVLSGDSWQVTGT